MADMHTIHSHTIEAFSERVDYGEVVTGASTNQKVKWTPLLNLEKSYLLHLIIEQ